MDNANTSSTTPLRSVSAEETITAMKSEPRSLLVAQFRQRFAEILAAAHFKPPPTTTTTTTAGNEHTCPFLLSFAPGRINLIGEHVDYVGGSVLPASIDKGVYVFANSGSSSNEQEEDKATATAKLTVFCHDGSERCDFIVRLSESGDGRLDVEVQNSGNNNSASPTFRWVNYVRAAIKQIRIATAADGTTRLPAAVQLAVFSSLPIGAGLSSSAALCVALINAFARIFNATQNNNAAAVHSKTLPPSAEFAPVEYSARTQLALAAQATEHAVGIKCGIMDQIASLFGSATACLLTDCGKLAVTAVPLDGLVKRAGVKIVLVDSLVQHELGTAYNEIRAAIERAQESVAAATKTTSATSSFSAVEWAKRELQEHRKNSINAGSDEAATETARVIGLKLKAIAMDKAGVSETDAAKLFYVASETVRTELFCELVQRAGTCPPSKLPDTVRQLGELLNATHDGLSQILGVSTAELDFIQKFLVSRKQSAATSLQCLGARMMGGGGGGCVLALLWNEAASTQQHHHAHRNDEGEVKPEEQQQQQQQQSDKDEHVIAHHTPGDISVFMDELGDSFGSTFFASDPAFRARWYDVQVGPGASLIL